MLLSVDWDAFSGTRELVFDAPVWGTRDRAHDRTDAWWTRALKRGGTGWDALDDDYPLYPGWEATLQYAGVPAFVALSHADAWAWLRQFPGEDVVNVDSHHDLASFSGDPRRVRPGNWAGLGLEAGLIRTYTCVYPSWHATLPVAEGFDLTRTRAEVGSMLLPDVFTRATLHRQSSPHQGWPDAADVRSLLLVQSPSWTNPAHDPAFMKLAGGVGATPITEPLHRPAPCTAGHVRAYNQSTFTTAPHLAQETPT
ncbi:arginase [Deinococcus sp.]|uniref:arginase n=1 Tax=Deinococcus sp. TaxID=47478 RepID=UPI002869815B|nr:arginase [Deinococcus sp.]